MEKRDLHSPDLTARNIERIAELFPHVMTEAHDAEGKVTSVVDFDVLRQELSDHVVEGPHERYQLNWPGKRAAAFAANAPIAKTLRPVREESVDFGTTKNLFIEGDNLDALKLLQESYLGKVKLIYIDPPYNTGNDFVYDDDFAESTADYLRRSDQMSETDERLVANTEADGRFHTKWLSMLYPRLKLARNLLTDDGLIFVSIDDNELHNLRSLMSEIYGGKNFVGIISRATGTPTGGGFDGLSNMLDYLVVFRRTDLAVLNGLAFGEADESIYNQSDDSGRYLTRSLRRTGGEDRREDRPSMHYGLSDPDGGVVYPVGPGGYASRWICGQARFMEMDSSGLIEWRKNATTGWHPYQKFYLAGRKKRPSNLWNEIDGNKKGTREIRNLFESEKIFDSPKPSALLERIVEIATTPDSLVLDFFAGSATTAEAVMRRNTRDGGSRRWILTQIAESVPEGTAASRAGYQVISEISRERIRRAGKFIADAADGKAAIMDLGFRSFRADSSNLKDTSEAPDRTDQHALRLFETSVKPDRTGEDLLFQVLLDWGLDLSLPLTRGQVGGREVLDVDDGALVACFDLEVTPAVVRAMAERQPLRAVFLDAGFVDDAARINAEQIFHEVSPGTDVTTI